jgi:hypothetical protein
MARIVASNQTKAPLRLARPAGQSEERPATEVPRPAVSIAGVPASALAMIVTVIVKQGRCFKDGAPSPAQAPLLSLWSLIFTVKGLR